MSSQSLPFASPHPGWPAVDGREDAKLGGTEVLKPQSQPGLFFTLSEADFTSSSSLFACYGSLPPYSAAEQSQLPHQLPLPPSPPARLHSPLYHPGHEEMRQQAVVSPSRRPKRLRLVQGAVWPSVAQQVRLRLDGSAAAIQAYDRHNDLGLCRHLCCCEKPDSDPRQAEALDRQAVELLRRERLLSWQQSEDAVAALGAQCRGRDVVVQQQAAIKKGSRAQHEGNDRLHPHCNDACRRYRGLQQHVAAVQVQTLLELLPLPDAEADGAAEVQLSLPAHLLPLARRAVDDLLRRALQDEEKRGRQAMLRSRREEQRKDRQRSKKQNRQQL